MSRKGQGPQAALPTSCPETCGWLHLASHTLRRGPHVKNCSSTWILREELWSPGWWPDRPREAPAAFSGPVSELCPGQ